MIFVTLGTQDKSFHRLLEVIQKLIDEKIIDEEVIVQAGSTKFSSKQMKIFDFVDMHSFNDYMGKCDVLITHGGVGSIINGLNQNKKVIAIARLEKYGEHENDHQVQIINEFKKNGHILGCNDVCELQEEYLKVNDFKSEPYTSNNLLFCKLIHNLIEGDTYEK